MLSPPHDIPYQPPMLTSALHHQLHPCAQPLWLKHPPHRWQPGTLDRPALEREVTRLHSSPAFDQASPAIAEQIQRIYHSHWALSRLLSDQARYQWMIFVLYLHHQAGGSEEGVTYSRLVELFKLGEAMPAGKMASPTRIKAMLGLSLASGYLRRQDSLPGDKRTRLLVPTQKMIDSTARWFRGCYSAYQVLRPLAMPLDEMLALPGFWGELMSYNTYGLLHDHFTLHERIPIAMHFGSRTNSYLCMLEVVRTMRRDHGTGQWTASMAPVDMANRMSLSRGNVRSILDETEALGHVQVTARGGRNLILTDEYARQMRYFVASEIVLRIDLANATAIRLRALQGDRSGAAPAPAQPHPHKANPVAAL